MKTNISTVYAKMSIIAYPIPMQYWQMQALQLHNLMPELKDIVRLHNYGLQLFTNFQNTRVCASHDR